MMMMMMMILNYKTETSFEPFQNSFSNFWQNRNTLRLLLFFDEIEVKNPLGDIAGVFKLGMFYFSIIILGSHHNSSLCNRDGVSLRIKEYVCFKLYLLNLEK